MPATGRRTSAPEGRAPQHDIRGRPPCVLPSAVRRTEGSAPRRGRRGLPRWVGAASRRAPARMCLACRRLCPSFGVRIRAHLRSSVSPVVRVCIHRRLLVLRSGVLLSAPHCVASAEQCREVASAVPAVRWHLRIIRDLHGTVAPSRDTGKRRNVYNAGVDRRDRMRAPPALVCFVPGSVAPLRGLVGGALGTSTGCTRGYPLAPPAGALGVSIDGRCIGKRRLLLRLVVVVLVLEFIARRAIARTRCLFGCASVTRGRSCPLCPVRKAF